MKTNEMTLTASGQGIVSGVAAWMQQEFPFYSDLLGTMVSRGVALGSLVSSLSLTGVIVLLSLSEPAYGWAVFCGLLAVVCGKPMFNIISKGGEE